MRCTQCEMPLSPTNTSMWCPRCHTLNGVRPKSTVPLSSQQHTDPAWGRPGGTQHYGQGQVANAWQVEASPQMPFPSAPLFSSETADGQQNRVSLSPMVQVPFPQAGQMWQPSNPQAAVSVATSSPPPAPIGANMRSSGTQYAMPNRITASMYSAPAPAVRPQPPRVSNVGFIVGGLCVIVGAVILIFVYVMAQTLLVTSTSTAPTSTLLTTTHTMPSPSVTIHTPTVVTSPTIGTFPGQQYIDNPQMASAVNTNTAQPLQVTAIFQPNQRIYVTFDVHPNGNNGAVCLVWYLNNRIVTQFPFTVTANARAGYSYAVYGVSGTGYVEIYWASSVACSDKLLAQHVSFTILK